nr:hypothetical protein CFP56_65495 [Quercus suber]
MKIAALLATTGLACLVTADVQLFTDTQCMSNDFLYSTDAGNCYTLDTLAMDYFSALGCSVELQALSTSRSCQPLQSYSCIAHHSVGLLSTYGAHRS